MSPVCVLLLTILGGAQDTLPAPTDYRGKSAGAWVAELAEDDVRRRWHATHALGQLGPAAAEAVGPLMELLADRSRHEYVRGGAARALGRIGPDAERAIPLLIEMLDSIHLSVQRNAPTALGEFGPKAAAAADKLRTLSRAADPLIRVNAAEALWKITQEAGAISALEAELRQPDTAGCYQAAAALGRVASNCPAAIAALSEALGHTDADVARRACWALESLGRPALEPLCAAAGDAREPVRFRAIEGLGQLGPLATPRLVRALEDESPRVRRSVAKALGRLAPVARETDAAAAEQIEQALLAAVSDADREVREEAARALTRLDTGSG